ncbi:anthocyanidin 3-O-glucoside 2'''-O-xylosyltransferase-like isoform X2 [Sesamum indicum]|uniref:Anthocyanidin 3-O-glucoside 2'''-O-xylosyltransferase-like isoform X1 n=1 Tax=Sesamum indicum TaxID=4182 RepID=A0A6I9TDI7_SESIN|nr:anthocyanidin 3-O-glucoside 2'''-O-xylosyltransferase-like isoform X1 [Sesamum indicum]XP_011082712.1 anthocyanidin 3-O-glucoside 2'''-O-xylosyltransferase-like isoform X3 [Sesamum indicum]XP_020550275.1 anthocyanidin 3-O-glucoside 2'''-O-xylosyltransferase-like isoform X2 [Sesamum indicum]
MPEFEKSKLHIAMFPWVAIGHITPFIHLANELAKRGHSISILIPNKPLLQLGHHSLYPDLIKFHVVTIPQVEGLPPGAETASDIDITAKNPLAIAFDATAEQVETILSGLKPDIVFYDFADWIPKMAARVGFKTVCYNVICASCMAIGIVPARHIPKDRRLTEEELGQPPKGYPSSTVVLRGQEALTLSFIAMDYGATKFDVRITAAMQGCDAIGIRTCRELEGPMCDYLSEQYNKPVFLSGPVLPENPKGALEEKWDKWLSKFKPKSVVYCAFGSQLMLQKKQFQEMVLGFEMTGLPFFVAVSKPHGADSIEEALPEGFLERVGDRGVVHGGWVQQTQGLNHPSVGCFVSHCGFGSMWESLLSESQIVLVPRLADQILNTRLLAEELKVAVEVERGEMGWFSKEDLSKAIKSVMDEESEVGKLVKENHGKWRETLMSPEFMDNYVDNFIRQLYQLL